MQIFLNKFYQRSVFIDKMQYFQYEKVTGNR